MNKEKTILLVIITFMASLLGVLMVYAATLDITPPVLKSISLKEKTEWYKPGDKVYLNLDAYDDISGIKRVTLYYTNVQDWFNETLDSKDGLGFYVTDINTNPYIEIPNGLKPGEWELTEVSLIDGAGNQVQYYINNNDYLLLPYQQTGLKLNWDMKLNINSSPALFELPVLRSLTNPNKTYKIGETITINAELQATNGVYEAQALYKNIDNNSSITINLLNTSGSKFVGSYIIPNYLDGTFEFDSIIIWGNNSAKAIYVPKNSNYIASHTLLKTLDDFDFSISGGSIDNEAPYLGVVNLDKSEVNAPSLIKVHFKVSEDFSGVDIVQLAFAKLNKLEASSWVQLSYNEKTFEYEGILNINQYYESGTYVITEIQLSDKAGNIRQYVLDEYQKYSIKLTNSVKEPLKKMTFEVVQPIMIGLTSSTISKDLLDKINKAKDGSNIFIDSTNNAIISKDIFEAIKGTNKTIYIESNGIQWVFNGKDIKDIRDIKDIDVKVNIGILDNATSYVPLIEMLDKALVINFANNGKLPGVVLVRIKIDYALSEYLGIEELKAYHYNPDTRLFDRVAKGINITDDGYLEFYISHNSTFVILDKEPNSKYISDDESMLNLNEDKAIDNNNSDNKIYLTIGIITIIVLLIGALLFIKRTSIFKK